MCNVSSRYQKICKPLLVYRFYCMALFHSHIDARRHMFFRLSSADFFSKSAFSKKKKSAKELSRQQKSSLARKELKYHFNVDFIK